MRALHNTELEKFANKTWNTEGCTMTKAQSDKSCFCSAPEATETNVAETTPPNTRAQGKRTPVKTRKWLPTNISTRSPHADGTYVAAEDETFIRYRSYDLKRGASARTFRTHAGKL